MIAYKHDFYIISAGMTCELIVEMYILHDDGELEEEKMEVPLLD